ncbi:MAG: alpha/beta fold hydrolase [Burkholderiaceae bacterium]
MSWFESFTAQRMAVNGSDVFVRTGGNPAKPALMLLHGFPQTHAMWQRVARALREDYFLVLPDLRGYGDSAKPPGLPDHSNYSKRAMAHDLVLLMEALDRPQFGLCGHDRGGRVAHRLALDHAERVTKLCLIDIAPTLDMYNNTTMAFAQAYYHWFHMIQPSPLPEIMMGAHNAETALSYLHAKLGGWGSDGLDFIEPLALAEYERCFCNADTLHAVCEDYRASASVDLEHDQRSRERGHKISCDLLILWGNRGVVQRLFKPLELWQAQCGLPVLGQLMPAGHFIPEELPEATALALQQFFR